MLAIRFPATCATALVVLLLVVVTPAVAGDESGLLKEAIELFDGGDYLASQELLLGIDRSGLTRTEQSARDDYLTRVQVALTMYEKALRDLEDAETALAEAEHDRAASLLNAVITNEYAAEQIRRSARAHLRNLTERPGAEEEIPPSPATSEHPVDSPTETGETPPAQQSQGPGQEGAGLQREAAARGPDDGAVATNVALERARVLTQEADDLVQGGRYAEAERLYHEATEHVPGYPDAIAGARRARQHARTAAGSLGESLIERLRRRDAINWQRTLSEYREAERSIREFVASQHFEQANQMLLRARQVIEAGRQFADPATRFDNLRSEVGALATLVRNQERAFNDAQVAAVRREIEAQRADRLARIEESRARQVDALMREALQHRKDGKLQDAIGVLRQVTVIDPRNQPARWLMDILEDQWQYRRQREVLRDVRKQRREVLFEVEETKIPWHQLLQYPKDWLEIINRPERRLPGQTQFDRQLRSALDRHIPVDFQREPFGQVMTRLADAHQLNIVVNWNDLARAGVQRDVLIELSLPREITLRKALTEVLEQAGGGDVGLGFDLGDGVLTVATRQFLDQKTYPVVYDINDLLMVIPMLGEAPMTDLRHANPRLPRISGAADLPWQVGDDDDDEPEENPRRSRRVEQIIDLIQETIAPESWRERGGSIGSIKEFNGQLVVTQNSATQRRIGDLLSKLREERAIQIAVEAVFLTVSSHYLEELGLNLNVVFNAGNAGLDFIPGADAPLVDPVLGNRLLLPRTFSRLGFVPNTPGLGTGLNPDPNLTPTPQPFGQPFLIPRRAGGPGSQATPIPVITNILDFTNPGNMPSDIPGSFGGQDIGPALSVFGSFLDNIQVDFLLRATQADSRTSVITAPRVVVFNGFGAWVAVTIQQNFVSTLLPQIAQGAVAQQPIIGTIDAGAVLNIIQAVVTADKRYVMMTLSPGVVRLLDLQTFPFSGGTGALNAFIQIPTLSSLRVQTAVSVPDGGTLLIGGQKLASESEVEAGVPILSKIPILKRAYSSRTTVKDEQTLLILIKPKILIQTEQEELAFPSFAEGR